MNSHQRRLTAIAFVAIMLVVPMTAVNVVEDDNEADAAFWEPIVSITSGALYYPKSVIGLAFLAGAITGFTVGWTLYPIFHPSDGTPDDEVRRIEAAQLTQSLLTGLSGFDSALQTYTGVWGLTEEHWIRQAEITSSMYWEPDTAYSPYNTMTTSGTYVNSATMLVNGVNQINGQFAKVMERISQWNNSEVADYYGDGKMKMDFTLGVSSESFTGDEENLRVMFGSIVGSGNSRAVQEGRNAVYYVGGPVWASATATMVGTNGNVIQLQAGWNDLPDADEWELMDVYRLSPGVQYFGNFMYALEADAAPTQIALAADSGDGPTIFSCDGETLYDGTRAYSSNYTTDGVTESYDALKLSITPQNPEDKATIDITKVLIHYAQLNDEINRVVRESNSRASAIWSIYDDAGSATMYLTTLTVPETYKNVELTEEQQKLLVTLSMDQLSTWWKEHDGEIKQDDYRMTMDSLTLYCRGDITIKSANPDGTTEITVMEDVAYTPMFYTSTMLKTGLNEIDNYGFVLIYGECDSLSDFHTADYEGCDIQFVEAGAILGVAEMIYDGNYTQSVDLKSSEVPFIDFQDWGGGDEPWTPKEDAGDLGEMIRLIFIIFGAGLILYGASSRDWRWVVVGIILVAVGFFLADGIASWLNEWFGWRALWPF